MTSGQWTVDTLRANVDQQFAALERLLTERKETSDEAGKVALAAQQTAMRTALEAAEKAVNVALISAEKAVNKAEVAADKRFESMNEFRQQLSDQAASFMPRTEADIRINALTMALSEHERRSEENFGLIRSSLDVLQTQSSSSATQRTDMARLIAIIISVIAVAAAVYAVIKP